METRDTCPALYQKNVAAQCLQSKQRKHELEVGGGEVCSPRVVLPMNRERCKNPGNSQAKYGILASAYLGGDFQKYFRKLVWRTQPQRIQK